MAGAIFVWECAIWYFPFVFNLNMVTIVPNFGNPNNIPPFSSLIATEKNEFPRSWSHKYYLGGDIISVFYIWATFFWHHVQESRPKLHILWEGFFAHSPSLPRLSSYTPIFRRDKLKCKKISIGPCASLRHVFFWCVVFFV